MNRKNLKAIVIASALTCALSVSANAASIGGAMVKADALNLRSKPSTDASIITLSPNGSLVVVGEKVNDSWYKVVYRGTTGYMASDYLTFSENLDGYFGSGRIYGTDVRLRDSASMDSNVIGCYGNGTVMQVIGVYENWYKVKYNSTVGYVHSDYFSLSDVNGPSEGEDSLQGQMIVDTAMKYIGVPYVWGGTSESGFDCSGLVHYVYKECGYSIDRTAATIYDDGIYVSKSDLQIGDAICFSSASSSIGHVGIYIGGGQFIHASSSSGSVIISDLNSDYYTSHYVGARRIV
ncbi:MAG: SH3 domain-containing protein [Clostridiales bacterium]|jgi:uncharacterized protein YgiM (DUF1202 family)|nr:SH3 domain-containing protein [Clostridiales bacterium]